ncbi:MAG: hypothetical protein COB76_02440 [Alphaproteobacteria bacterium]|nr:MAG: hypothetical protein COB76_02440 [Alphaproteobacteria bacterium]
MTMALIAVVAWGLLLCLSRMDLFEGFSLVGVVAGDIVFGRFVAFGLCLVGILRRFPFFTTQENDKSYSLLAQPPSPPHSQHSKTQTSLTTTVH